MRHQERTERAANHAWNHGPAVQREDSQVDALWQIAHSLAAVADALEAILDEGIR